MTHRILSLITVAWLFLAPYAHAHETDTPHEETTTNQSTESTTTEPKQKVNFRAAPALIPLLLVPAALALYIAYKRLAQRK